VAGKTEVYTWRVSTALKAGLEEAARAQQRSVAELLDELVAKHLEGVRRETEPERQRRLHEQAAVFAGRITGRDSRRAERSRDLIRARLRRSSGAR
jgi:hypothetical protein